MSRPCNRSFTLIALVLACAQSPIVALADDAPKSVESSGKEPAKPDEPTVVRVAIQPATPPAAALTYPLLPRFTDLNPGNAVPLYMKVVAISAEKKESAEFWEKVDRWLESPLDKLPKAEVREVIAAHGPMLKIVGQAAHREECNWQPPVREDRDVFGILLPEIQYLRSVGRLLALKARLEIANGKPTDALATLQTGYALARHAGACPFLVCSLVGVAIAAQMDQQMLALMEIPNSPNMYWSLTALPTPIVDLRSSLDLESDSLFLAFPELRDVETAHHTPEEWDSLLVSFSQRWGEMALWVSGQKLNNLGTTAAMTGRAIAMIGQAKNDLVAAGRDRKAVNAMPTAQIVLLHTVITYKQIRDDEYKWFNLPYWQAREGLLAADKHLREDVRNHEIIPLASLLMPALHHVRRAMLRSERRIALLRVIEGLRFYAAKHDGKLPAALDDVKEVPLPLDPASNKPFSYRLVDGKATLDAPPATGEPWDSFGMRYEITVAKP